MPPQLRASRRRWLWPTITVLAAVASLSVGVGIGNAAADDQQVPQACLDAITTAEEGFAYVADAMTGMQNAFIALGQIDDTALTQATDDMTAATEQLDALTPRWDTARTDCRAAAGGQ